MTKAIEGKAPDHKWGKRARTLMRLVAGGAIEERELSKAVRTAEYSKHYANPPVAGFSIRYFANTPC